MFSRVLSMVSSSNDDDMDDGLAMMNKAEQTNGTSAKKPMMSIDTLKSKVYGCVAGKIEEDSYVVIGKDLPRLLQRITINHTISFAEKKDDTMVLSTSSSLETSDYLKERRKRMADFLFALCSEILFQKSPLLAQSIEETLAEEVNMEIHQTFTNFLVKYFGGNPST